MRYRLTILLAVALLLASTVGAATAQATPEKWTVLSVYPKPNVATPKSYISATLYTSPLSSGYYLISSQEFRAFIELVTGIDPGVLKGTHTIKRYVSSPGSETIYFSGPLSHLGLGVANSSQTTVTFRTRLGVSIIFARLKVPPALAPPPLWTTATNHVRLYGVPATADAADELGAFVREAEGVLEDDRASTSDYTNANNDTRALVDDAIANAISNGRSIIFREDVEKAKRRFVPSILSAEGTGDGVDSREGV